MLSLFSPLLLLIVLVSTVSSQTCTSGVTCSGSSSISISISGTDRVILSGGCPGYISTATTPGSATTQCITETLPLTPTLKDTPISIGLNSCLLGTIGRAINGVALYGPCDALQQDAYINEGSTFDPCGGHWAPTSGEYHYHVAATLGNTCIPGFTNTSGTAHSSLYAFMIDGVPLYGPYGDNGVLPTDLDSCGGHTDTTYSYYHYHTPATQSTYPYLVSCLKGCVPASINSQISKACTASATQYDYSSLASYGISPSVSASAVTAASVSTSLSGTKAAAASATGTGSRSISPSNSKSITGTTTGTVAAAASKTSSITGSKPAVGNSQSPTTSGSQSTTPSNTISNSAPAASLASSTGISASNSKAGTQSAKRSTTFVYIICKTDCQNSYRICKRGNDPNRFCKNQKKDCVAACRAQRHV